MLWINCRLCVLLICLVYRGHWCPFCIAYIREFTILQTAIKQAGGMPLIITSESRSFLPEFLTSTGWPGEAISDPENEIIRSWKENGWLDVSISEKAGYEHGMAQPAILIQKKTGEVIEKWAINPSLVIVLNLWLSESIANKGQMNLGGAKDRPVLDEVWENVKAKMCGKRPVHKEYTKMTFWNVLRQKFVGPK